MPEEPDKSVAAEYMPSKPTERAAGNLVELLERILDKGVVIIGDVRVSVADIELLKIQIRLLISSVEKAQEMGIDFTWAKQIESPDKERIKKLQERIKTLEEENAKE